MPRSIPYDEYLHKLLREDTDYAKGYLTEALLDEDPATFLTALRHVVVARGGGIAETARKTKRGEKSLHKTLSEKGNPELRSVRAILQSLGFHLAVS